MQSPKHNAGRAAMRLGAHVIATRQRGPRPLLFVVGGDGLTLPLPLRHVARPLWAKTKKV